MKNPIVRFKSGPTTKEKIFFRVSHPLLESLIHIPLISLFFYLGTRFLNPDYLWYKAFGIFLAGWVFYPVLDYFIHRFFHIRNIDPSYVSLHLEHHKSPQDPLVALVPPVAFLFIGFLIFSLCFILSHSPAFAVLYAAGSMLGLLTHDWLHFSIHHFNLKAPWLKVLKENHLKHHDHPHHNLDTLTTFMDKVMKTSLKNA